MDCSLPGFSVHGILQARTLEWVAISFSNAWKWKVKVKSLSHVQLLVTPWTSAYQAPPSMGFSRQQYWSGVPFPSPEIPAGLFKSLKGWWWWCHQSFVFVMSANLKDPTMATELEKVNPHPNSQEEFTEEWVNHWTITLISHSSKVILKILQARLQHYVNQKLPDVQAGIRKGRGARDQIANIFWIIEKAREFQKNHLRSLFHWLH